MNKPRVTIAGVYKALDRFGLDPAWQDPISIAHRCPGCGAASTTVEYEVAYFATYCDGCEIEGPRGFEAMARLAVQHAKRRAA